ncbi:MAG: PDZ domain-containing protein [Acidobacteriota bacterium]
MGKGLKQILGGFFLVVLILFFSVNVRGDNKRKIDIKEITKKVFPSVVKVESTNGMRKVATGVVIEKQGYIVTTALVSPVGTDIFIKTSKGEKYKADFIGMDPVTHLALVKAEGRKWKPIEWGEKKRLESGSWISVVSISPEDAPAVTEGIVSSVGRDQLRLNVCVMPGSSGSPVLNERGQMVGLVRGVYSGQTMLDVQRDEGIKRNLGRGTLSLSIVGTPVSGLAVAIPVNVVRKITSEIKEKGKVQRGWLGIAIIENQFDEVQVVEVDEESPAKKAGLREGDIIIEFDGEKVTSTSMLAHEIRMHKPGDKIEIVIKRNQKKDNLQVELGEYSEKSIIAEFKEKFPLLFSPNRFKLEKVTKPEQWSFSIIDRERNYIGVYLEEINRDLSEYFGLSEGTGLLVTKIVEDSPADKAGLKVGDVIIKADGKRIKTRKEIGGIIQEKEKNEKMVLVVIRDREEKKIELDVKQEKNEYPSLSYFENFSDHVYKNVNEAEDSFQRKFRKYRCIRV